MRTTLLTLLNKLGRLQATAGVCNIVSAEESANLIRPLGITTRSQRAAQPLPAPAAVNVRPDDRGPGNGGAVGVGRANDGPVDGAPRNIAPATPGPSTMAPELVGAAHGGPAVSGPVVSGPAVGGPATAGPATAGPATAAPAIAVPANGATATGVPVNLQMATNPVTGAPANLCPPTGPNAATAAHRQEDLMYWDSLVDMADAVNAEQAATDPASDVPPEKMKLPLPSNKSVPETHCALELLFRRRKAKALLTQIRELIAEKSFKYTDEIRKAPRKGVRTRGQTAVIELNRRLSLLCQVYAWNRARMVDLEADEDTLAAYQILQKDDVRCSTAVLQPNKSGSTKLKLSWIWHSIDRRVIAGLGTPETSDPATLTECASLVRRRMSANFAQSAEYIGCVPVRQWKGGGKKPFWSGMKCSGRLPTTNTKVVSGPLP